MNPTFSFDLVLAFTAMGVCIWLGVLLRAKIKFLRKFLVPASLLGGIIGVIAFNLGLIPLSADLFQAIAYHLFIISFIAIGLSAAQKAGDSGIAKQVFKGSGWMAIMNTFSMSTQLLIGMGLAGLLGLLGFNLHEKFGYLLALGFTQGPGQALTFGSVWQSGAGFEHGITLGLTFASLGFVFAFALGVPLAYWGMKKGYTADKRNELPDYVLRGYHLPDEKMEVAGYLPVHSGNLDAFAFQFGAIGIVYGLTWFIYWLLSKAIGPDTMSSLWGFFFAIALLLAFLMQLVMKKLKIFYLLDQGLQRRISGWAVDYLVVATLIPISFWVVGQFIVPILLLSVVGGLWTLAFGYYFGKRMSPLGFERMLAIYGANTGTMASGLLLLRIVDPDFKTTVNMECGSYVLLVFPAITLMLALINFGNLNPWLIAAILAVISVACLVLLKVLKMWGKPTAFEVGANKQ